MNRLTELQVLSAALENFNRATWVAPPSSSVSGNAEQATAFLVAVDNTTKILELTDDDLSRILGVARPSLVLWRAGSHAPHPFIRMKMVGLLRREVLHRQLVEAAKIAASLLNQQKLSYPTLFSFGCQEAEDLARIEELLASLITKEQND